MLEPLDHMLPRAETTLLSQHPENSDKDIDGVISKSKGIQTIVYYGGTELTRGHKNNTHTHM